MKYFARALLFITIVGIAVAAYVVPHLKIVQRFEKKEPNIELSTPLPGIGLKPIGITISADDLGSGIAEIWADLSQENQGSTPRTLQIFHQTFEDASPSVSLNLELPPAPRGFINGPAKIILRARDNSYWGNQKTTEKVITIDLNNPKVEILSGAVNTEHSGVGLVFFRVTKESLPKSRYILVDKLSFPTFPAAKLEEYFAGKSDIFFGFFSVPFGYDNIKNPVKVVVETQVGNTGQASVITHIKPRTRPRADLKLTKVFLETKVEELFQAYELEQRNNSVAEINSPNFETTGDSKLKSEEPHFLNPNETSAEKIAIAKFREVNENYRKLNARIISTYNKKSTDKQLWQGPFIRPIAAKTTSRFGEERFYSYEALDAGGSFHDGLDLASIAQGPVKSANSGVVLFVGDLGIYGNAIIIDHGFGITSLYGHLSATAVDEGQVLAKGDTIGRTGETGLAGGDHLHFEIRLNDQPITPIEWWDSQWMKDRLESKIAEVKNFLSEK